MIAFTFNSVTPAFNLSWESFALRVGLFLIDDVCCMGPSDNIITFEHDANKLSPSEKMRLIKSHVTQAEDQEILENAYMITKQLRKIKHPSQRDIVLLKRGEKIIDSIYEHYLTELIPQLASTGLPELAHFHYSKDKSLFLFHIAQDSGEQHLDGSLSKLLSFEWDEDMDPVPVVVIFYEKLGQTVSETFDCTPLAVLPNLSALSKEKLINMRQRLEPERNELKSFLPILPADEDGRKYHSGYWDVDGIKAFAPRLQQALNSAPELELITNFQKDFRAELAVGNMSCPELWQLLNNNGIIPKDSWELLQLKMESGKHSPTVPFITISSSWATAATNNLSEEESLTHKRKTINLD